jgi:hypothetical protein
LDTFYIDDPTLAFINSVYWDPVFIISKLTVFLVNIGMQSFTYAEYLLLAMAKVWAGKADLPNTTELWRRYDKVVKDRGGYRKKFQSLGPEGTKGSLVLAFSLFLKFDIFLMQLHCDFSKAGSMLMLLNMVGGR